MSDVIGDRKASPMLTSPSLEHHRHSTSNTSSSSQTWPPSLTFLPSFSYLVTKQDICSPCRLRRSRPSSFWKHRDLNSRICKVSLAPSLVTGGTSQLFNSFDPGGLFQLLLSLSPRWSDLIPCSQVQAPVCVKGGYRE